MKQAKQLPHGERTKRARAAIRRFHPRGWSDAEVAAHLRKRGVGVVREYVCQLRREMGLGHNAYSEHRRRKVSERTRQQVKAAGLKSLADVRVKSFRDFARRHGWPEDLRPRAVQMLTALFERGPMTRREIADAIGMPWKGARKSLVSNDPEGSYLAHLQKRGLVICQKRKLRMGGQGHNVGVYLLAPAVAFERQAQLANQGK